MVIYSITPKQNGVFMQRSRIEERVYTSLAEEADDVFFSYYGIYEQGNSVILQDEHNTPPTETDKITRDEFTYALIDAQQNFIKKRAEVGLKLVDYLCRNENNWPQKRRDILKATIVVTFSSVALGIAAILIGLLIFYTAPFSLPLVFVAGIIGGIALFVGLGCSAYFAAKTYRYNKNKEIIEEHITQVAKDIVTKSENTNPFQQQKQLEKVKTELRSLLKDPDPDKKERVLTTFFKLSKIPAEVPQALATTLTEKIQSVVKQADTNPIPTTPADKSMAELKALEQLLQKLLKEPENLESFLPKDLLATIPEKCPQLRAFILKGAGEYVYTQIKIKQQEIAKNLEKSIITDTTNIITDQIHSIENTSHPGYSPIATIMHNINDLKQNFPAEDSNTIFFPIEEGATLPFGFFDTYHSFTEKTPRTLQWQPNQKSRFLQALFIEHDPKLSYLFKGNIESINQAANSEIIKQREEALQRLYTKAKEQLLSEVQLDFNNQIRSIYRNYTDPNRADKANQLIDTLINELRNPNISLDQIFSQITNLSLSKKQEYIDCFNKIPREMQIDLRNRWAANLSQIIPEDLTPVNVNLAAATTTYQFQPPISAHTTQNPPQSFAAGTSTETPPDQGSEGKAQTLEASLQPEKAEAMPIALTPPIVATGLKTPVVEEEGTKESATAEASTLEKKQEQQAENINPFSEGGEEESMTGGELFPPLHAAGIDNEAQTATLQIPQPMEAHVVEMPSDKTETAQHITEQEATLRTTVPTTIEIIPRQKLQQVVEEDKIAETSKAIESISSSLLIIAVNKQLTPEQQARTNRVVTTISKRLKDKVPIDTSLIDAAKKLAELLDQLSKMIPTDTTKQEEILSQIATQLKKIPEQLLDLPTEELPPPQPLEQLQSAKPKIMDLLSDSPPPIKGEVLQPITFTAPPTTIHPQQATTTTNAQYQQEVMDIISGTPPHSITPPQTLINIETSKVITPTSTPLPPAQQEPKTPIELSQIQKTPVPTDQTPGKLAIIEEIKGIDELAQQLKATTIPSPVLKAQAIDLASKLTAALNGSQIISAEQKLSLLEASRILINLMKGILDISEPEELQKRKQAVLELEQAVLKREQKKAVEPPPPPTTPKPSTSAPTTPAQTLQDLSTTLATPSKEITDATIHLAKAVETVRLAKSTGSKIEKPMHDLLKAISTVNNSINNLIKALSDLKDIDPTDQQNASVIVSQLESLVSAVKQIASAAKNGDITKDSDLTRTLANLTLIVGNLHQFMLSDLGKNLTPNQKSSIVNTLAQIDNIIISIDTQLKSPNTQQPTTPFNIKPLQARNELNALQDRLGALRSDKRIQLPPVQQKMTEEQQKRMREIAEQRKKTEAAAQEQDKVPTAHI